MATFHFYFGGCNWRWSNILWSVHARKNWIGDIILLYVVKEHFGCLLVCDETNVARRTAVVATMLDAGAYINNRAILFQAIIEGTALEIFRKGWPLRGA